MNVLVIDTSNYPLSIAVMNDKMVIAETMINSKKNHSLQAMPAIESTLASVDLSPKDLDRIVVAQGPGSYTGVRIGVTIAKTLAWTLKIPLVGVSSLAALTGPGRYFDGLMCPVFDARRGQAYTALYRFDEGQLVEVIKDTNVLMEDWIAGLSDRDEKILFTGQDVEGFWQQIKERLGNRAFRTPITGNLPRASEIGLIGMELEPGEVHDVVPNYIRLAEAEVKWLESQKREKDNE
ncbi:tRNA (adenosine(37)-N6)-threonylcarbamoyltransferase complex dimerization subunit type 1 TsaB [Jeotgalibacillus proteolyticus]|uniref:tRNA (Adenosine(37)-N6)-threonylcarbamoyltransferase complex dimerization subunit type 1 TsaB n=1 Tax=Jeotgalibacillus proteolyticus TaxID=2082395 RepID=A0A2S5G639_9BACL|nr:tRNA (adenosine(37)-N6)-threonylcarbamoyltransferase complex dimerization subunit type 1 TsaB [Jeotgalibacillus proteolyticus]PPA68452.1 tRNA (adenosine(37)-N6)-threonylcarbamoyltransferase complex dimerization subunit type 1 TsaB [Jeotgalibacillus proteolyticus]